MHLSEKQIELIIKVLKNKPVLKGYIFGSFARGEATKNSDIDLLIDLDYSKHIGLEFVGIQLELEEALHRKVDLHSSLGLSKHLKPYIEKEKQVIYEKA